MSTIADLQILCRAARPFSTRPYLVVSQMPATEIHHRFNVVLKGLSHINDNGTTYTAGPGDVIYYPPRYGREEWNDVAHPLRCMVLLFDWPDAPADLPRIVRDDGRIRQLAGWLVEDMTVRQRYRHSQMGLMTAIVSEYMTLVDIAARSPDDILVAAARRFVQSRLATPPSLDELAAHLEVDKYTLIRRYRASVGRTPMQDARGLRLEQAKMLLLTTDQTIGEIAPQVGFRCPFHLSRAYQAQFGMPPSKARIWHT